VNWTQVGVITGIIGTITGVFGAYMGVLNYRRTSRLKTLDLRLELRKRAADLASAWRGLPGAIEHANGSRFAVRVAQGRARGGEMEAWTQQLTADLAAVRALQSRVDTSDNKYDQLTEHELEDKLVEVHGLTATVNQYADKYRAALAADDRDRERIADNAQKWVNRNS
jgi:hypothetical protein